MWMCVVFASGLLAASPSPAFAACPSIADAAERDASLGYAWFWTFLAVVALVFGSFPG